MTISCPLARHLTGFTRPATSATQKRTSRPKAACASDTALVGEQTENQAWAARTLRENSCKAWMPLASAR